MKSFQNLKNTINKDAEGALWEHIIVVLMLKPLGSVAGKS